MRPKTLAEVAQRTLGGSPFDVCLKNFLDEFRANSSAETLAEEPARLEKSFPGIGAVQDAYLAAVAESLADSANVRAPIWAFGENRTLKRPWFALDYSSLRAVLLWESPAAFRSRNLFVSENALSRV